MVSVSHTLWALTLSVSMVMTHRYVSTDGENLWHESLDYRFSRVPNRGPQIGSFGVTWLVRDAQSVASEEGAAPHDDIVALKLLHANNELLTPAKANANENLKQDALAGLKECNIQKELATKGKESQDLVARKGAQRMITCHETNIPPESDEQKWSSPEPMWILMENGGDKTLDQWIGSGEWDAAKAKILFKQLIEGLSFLGSTEPAYIHHDLKPSNCVIRQTQTGELLLNMIDFGSAAKITQESRFGPDLAFTDQYYPWELDEEPRECLPEGLPPRKQNFALCASDNCGAACGLAFDIFAAGQIWIAMMLGQPSEAWTYTISSQNAMTVQGIVGMFRRRLNYRKNATSPKLKQEYKEMQFEKFSGIFEELESNGLLWQDMKKTVDQMLLKEPKDRIQAREILRKDWIQNIQTPDE